MPPKKGGKNPSPFKARKSPKKNTKSEKSKTDQPTTRERNVKTNEKDLEESRAIPKAMKQGSKELKEGAKGTSEDKLKFVTETFKDLQLASQQPLPPSSSSQSDEDLTRQALSFGKSDSTLPKLQSPSSPTDSTSSSEQPSFSSQADSSLAQQLPSDQPDIKPTDKTNVEAAKLLEAFKDIQFASQQPLPSSSQSEEESSTRQPLSFDQSDSPLPKLQSPSSPTDSTSSSEQPSFSSQADSSLTEQLPSDQPDIKPTDKTNAEAAKLIEEREANWKAFQRKVLCDQILRIGPLREIGDFQKYFNKFYDHFYLGICKSYLMDKVEAEFIKIKNDYDRIRYVLQFQEIEKLKISIYNSKSESYAKALEEEYKNWCDHESTEQILLRGLKLINRSIQFTPSVNRKSIGIRIMKRAWINLLLKKFEEAREDAHRSLEYHSDHSDMWNSLEILGYCYAMREENRKAEHYLEDAVTGLRQSDKDNAVKAPAAVRIFKLLKYVKKRKDVVRSDENYAQGLIKPRISGINPILKCATDAVEVKVEETGRAIYAKRDLKPGDLIMVEDPYVSALHRENFETHCNYCYKRFRSSIPCDTCSRVWFCSEECLKEAKAGFHSSECHVLNFLYEDGIDNMGIVVFRILLRLTWENIKSLRNDGEIDTTLPDSHPLHTEFNWQETYCTYNYLTIYKLVTNSERRCFDDLFKKTIIAVYLKQCLKEVGFFKGDNVSLEDEIFVASLILKHIQSYSCNAHTITEFNFEKSYVENVDIIDLGGSIYPTISLINHSCDPNVFNYSIGEVCVVRATKIIGKGKQLFDSYGPIFNEFRKESRRTELKNQYMFDCKCIACKENWPLLEEHTVYMKFACPVKGCKQIVEYDGKENMNCPSCGFKKEHKNLKKEAKFKIEEFNKKGMDFLKVGHKDNEALIAIKQFQMYADKNIIAPSRCLADCQEMLKRCFLLQGNVFNSKRK